MLTVYRKVILIMSSITVRVKDLTGKEYSLTVSNSVRMDVNFDVFFSIFHILQTTTLGQLKTSLQAKSGISLAQQNLIFQGKTLSDNSRRLSQLGIVNGSILQILVLPGRTIKVDNLMSPGTVLEVFMEGQSSELQVCQYYT